MNNIKESIMSVEDAIKNRHLWPNNEVIEVFEDSLEALEKQVAIKPTDYIIINDCFADPKKVHLCPMCKSELIKVGSYCFVCGQKIDWEE